jgi:hypothetical protein
MRSEAAADALLGMQLFWYASGTDLDTLPGVRIRGGGGGIGVGVGVGMQLLVLQLLVLQLLVLQLLVLQLLVCRSHTP